MLNFEMFKLDIYMCIRMQLYTIVTFVYDADTRAKKAGTRDEIRLPAPCCSMEASYILL